MSRRAADRLILAGIALGVVAGLTFALVGFLHGFYGGIEWAPLLCGLFVVALALVRVLNHQRSTTQR